jgi:hypothetical protein
MAAKTPGNYQFGDQYARLEAVRAYIQAAGEILAEARNYEARNPDPTYVGRGCNAVNGILRNANQTLQSLMGDMMGDLAIEGGEKSTIMPPAPEANGLDITTPGVSFPPVNLSELDDAFKGLDNQ